MGILDDEEREADLMNVATAFKFPAVSRGRCTPRVPADRRMGYWAEGGGGVACCWKLFSLCNSYLLMVQAFEHGHRLVPPSHPSRKNREN